MCFRWSLVGSMDVEPVFTKQNNDNARRRPLTRPGSLAALAAAVPCSLWCARAVEAFQKAARDFLDVQFQFIERKKCGVTHIEIQLARFSVFTNV